MAGITYEEVDETFCKVQRIEALREKLQEERVFLCADMQLEELDNLSTNPDYIRLSSAIKGLSDLQTYYLTKFGESRINDH